MNIWTMIIILGILVFLYGMWFLRPTVMKFILKAITIEKMYKEILQEGLDTSTENDRVIATGRLYILLEKIRELLEYETRIPTKYRDDPELHAHLKEILRIREEMGKKKASIDMM